MNELGNLREKSYSGAAGSAAIDMLQALERKACAPRHAWIVYAHVRLPRRDRVNLKFHKDVRCTAAYSESPVAGSLGTTTLTAARKDNFSGRADGTPLHARQGFRQGGSPGWLVLRRRATDGPKILRTMPCLNRAASLVRCPTVGQLTVSGEWLDLCTRSSIG